jgi:hypothetical protein
MLLAYRLVRLIETHSDQLSSGLLHKIHNSEKCRDFSRVPAEEFQQRTSEVYHHLGEWLLGKTEHDIERCFREIGQRRAVQGVPLSQVVWAIALTKENLMEFMQKEAAGGQPVEILGELEILQLLEQFFDRATFYAVSGYEHSRAAHATAAAKN